MLHFVDTKNVIGGFICNLEEQSQERERESVILDRPRAIPRYVDETKTQAAFDPQITWIPLSDRARKLYLPLHSSSMDALVKVFGGLNVIYGDNTENGFIFKHLTACVSGAQVSGPYGEVRLGKIDF